jgi:hypothetical protein
VQQQPQRVWVGQSQPGCRADHEQDVDQPENVPGTDQSAPRFQRAGCREKRERQCRDEDVAPSARNRERIRECSVSVIEHEEVDANETRQVQRHQPTEVESAEPAAKPRQRDERRQHQRGQPDEHELWNGGPPGCDVARGSEPNGDQEPADSDDDVAATIGGRGTHADVLLARTAGSTCSPKS